MSVGQAKNSLKSSVMKVRIGVHTKSIHTFSSTSAELILGSELAEAGSDLKTASEDKRANDFTLTLYEIMAN